MSYEVHDIVQYPAYRGGVLFRIVCFLDRGLPCPEHKGVHPRSKADDVHLEVVWLRPGLARTSSWDIGETVVGSYSNLEDPSGNEMLVLGLAAS